MAYSVEGSAANPFQQQTGMPSMMVQTQQQSPSTIVTLPPDFNLQQTQSQEQGMVFVSVFSTLLFY